MSYNIERKYGCCVQEDTQRHVQFTRSKMKKTTLLKNMLLSKEILVMPGAYDCISAKLIEKAGFRAAQCTGYGIAASRIGKPDVGILSVDVMLDATRNICHAVDIPVMADGDTGFGNVVNVWDTVIRFEEAGAAGINLEDQVFPKRCGHMNGKQVISSEEMVEKIKAARYAAYQGTIKALNIMKKEGIAPSAHHPEMLCSFEEFTDTIGLSEIEKIRAMFTEK